MNVLQVKTDNEIQILTLLVYLLLNWRFIRSKLVIIVPIIAGAVLWFFGLLALTEDDSWLVILGCCIFEFGVIVDSCVRLLVRLEWPLLVKDKCLV
ncbi:MAG: hypothetical protein U9N81_04515 [Bacillota bacterium]|nr:hypothetical protein [Bacillota bacterium]